MEKGKSSITSLISAFGRAYHHQFDSPKIFDDFLAQELISQEEFNDIKEKLIQGIQFFNPAIAEKFNGNPNEILKWITQIQLSPTPLARAAYCEEVVLHELEFGLKQVVLLGAGMDTFCLRHPELNHLEFFEVDHPATQAIKKKRLEQAGLTAPDNLHFVPMDFTKGFAVQSLIHAGMVHKKTLFSLLGVSYYLTKEENARLLENVFSKVPSGSSIVFDYADETLFETKGLSNRVENMVKSAAACGEPMKSCFSYQEMEHLLEESGLLIYEQLSPNQINHRYFAHRSDYLSAFETIHYIHAVKE
ncbi:class I SAM-dependent methyltransferase [Sporolactobacillus laevolacticus]|uniref:class I SAM-dependent methyltransferase n=1 Tax=Sporolactobacillus laevolacticus TaxID=33018 RepID=UPI0025B3B402|nr:class I SAM-dependent methyltransferase [Sporolactobacillus laevolacticus]MDN3956370.1 class I SAM-dependent methyltransferase [Sporolactobacillus laevolacticus]